MRSRKAILGLSHFIGETAEELDWTLVLDVPAEKRDFLRNRGARSVGLFLTEQHGWPVEWIRHRPPDPLPAKPAKIRLAQELATVRVAARAEAEELLRRLGFEAREGAWVLAGRLFRSLPLRLEEAADASAEPCIDDPGLTTISLLVKDLDAVAGELPLRAHQGFVLDGVEKEIAFYRGAGLLFEFLRVKARRPGAARDAGGARGPGAAGSA